MTTSAGPITRSRRRPHRVALLTMLVGIVVSVIATFAARRVAVDNERQLLIEDAGIAASELQAIASQVHNGLDSALAVLNATDGSPMAFRHVTSSDEDGLFTSWLVERRAGNRWSELLHLDSPAAPPQAVESQFGKLLGAAPGTFRILGFIGSGDSRLLAVGEVDRARQYALYAQLSLPESAVVQTQSFAGDPLGKNLLYALYLGSGESMANAVLTNTSAFPLTGQRAVATIDPSSGAVSEARLSVVPGATSVPPGDLLVVVSAKGWLSGGLASTFPWTLFAITLVAALAMATTVEVVLRRRDDALRLAARLETQRDDLDQALEDQRRSEQDRVGLEARLRAAQRMEVVGRLAGGVAHDFNNLLAVILNNAAFAVDALGDHPARDDVNEVLGAARRAAELTRQLLVFSRQDIVEPDLIDLNEVITEMERLLVRALDEGILFEVRLASALPLVRSNGGEIEQVLMNLVVNARDAMATSGGRLLISTSVVEVSEATPFGFAGLPAGAYVSLSVEDSGEGMAEDVLASAFEPFFSTKPDGQGTGLGLSTVYGIASRWNGDVRATSIPGAGTTVTLVLPVAEETARPVPEIDHEPRTTPMHAKILLVEDQPAVRRVAKRVLEGAGHLVFEASDGVEALTREDLPVADLLLTDVVMPGGVSGRHLGEELERRWPELRVLFMSGYTADVIASQGVLDEGIALLEKPFSAESLLEAVQNALEVPSGAR